MHKDKMQSSGDRLRGGNCKGKGWEGDRSLQVEDGAAGGQ